jgi:hypothetical protein
MAADERTLGGLHEKVTEALNQALDGDVIPGYTEVNEATGEVTQVPDRKLPPSAAIIAAATKFLKDNNITCAPSEDNAVASSRTARSVGLPDWSCEMLRQTQAS